MGNDHVSSLPIIRIKFAFLYFTSSLHAALALLAFLSFTRFIIATVRFLGSSIAQSRPLPPLDVHVIQFFIEAVATTTARLIHGADIATTSTVSGMPSPVFPLDIGIFLINTYHNERMRHT